MICDASFIFRHKVSIWDVPKKIIYILYIYIFLFLKFRGLAAPAKGRSVHSLIQRICAVPWGDQWYKGIRWGGQAQREREELLSLLLLFFFFFFFFFLFFFCLFLLLFLLFLVFLLFVVFFCLVFMVFPTCQVRVVRFYISHRLLLLLLLPSFLRAGPQPRAATSYREQPRPVFLAGPQPRPVFPAEPQPQAPCPVFLARPQPRADMSSVPSATSSVHCQTSAASTASSVPGQTSTCSLPDFNREQPPPVFPVGPQHQKECQKLCQQESQKCWRLVFSWRKFDLRAFAALVLACPWCVANFMTSYFALGINRLWAELSGGVRDSWSSLEVYWHVRTCTVAVRAFDLPSGNLLTYVWFLFFIHICLTGGILTCVGMFGVKLVTLL